MLRAGYTLGGEVRFDQAQDQQVVTSLYRNFMFSILHMIYKNVCHSKEIRRLRFHFYHACSCFKHQVITKSIDSKVHDPAPALPHNLSQKHPLGILHPNQTCMRNLMEIRGKRSGSIFQNFNIGNVSTNDK